MKTAHIKVDPKRLVPADDNPQRMPPAMFLALKNALANDVDTIDEPAVWRDPAGALRIISGHHRIRAAIELGWSKIAIKVFDDPACTELWYRKRVISVNKTHGDPDEDAIRAFLDTSIDIGSRDLPDFDVQAYMADSGYSSEEIQAYIDGDQEKRRYDGEPGALVARFGIPPLSVLDSRQGYWVERKRLWEEEIGDHGESRKDTLGRGSIVADCNNGVSILDPVLAEAVVNWFTTPGCAILDPFAGDTVFGYVAKKLGHRFTGIELRQEQATLNQQRCDRLRSRDYGSAVYHCDTSENVDSYVEDESQDLLFSCPPYYDLETYSDLPQDLSNQATYADFRAMIAGILTRSVRKLRRGRFAVITIGEIRDPMGAYRGLVPDMIDIMTKAGTSFYNEAILLTQIGTAAVRCNRMMMSRKLTKCHQNLLVFFKGNLADIRGSYLPIDLSAVQERIPDNASVERANHESG